MHYDTLLLAGHCVTVPLLRELSGIMGKSSGVANSMGSEGRGLLSLCPYRKRKHRNQMKHVAELNLNVKIIIIIIINI